MTTDESGFGLLLEASLGSELVDLSNHGFYLSAGPAGFFSVSLVLSFAARIVCGFPVLSSDVQVQRGECWRFGASWTDGGMVSFRLPYILAFDVLIRLGML